MDKIDEEHIFNCRTVYSSCGYITFKFVDINSYIVLYCNLKNTNNAILLNMENQKYSTIKKYFDIKIIE